MKLNNLYLNFKRQKAVTVDFSKQLKFFFIKTIKLHETENKYNTEK